MTDPHSSNLAFSARRRRLAQLRSGKAREVVVAAGWARPRNFAHNVYPFRAESHFLYFVGAHIEGAILVMNGESSCLYMEPPDPEMELWAGRGRSLDEWSEQLGLEVRPLDDIEFEEEAACLPPQDEETAAWLSALLSRPVEPQSGPELRDADAELAEQIVSLRLVHDEAARDGLRTAARKTAGVHVLGMQATRGKTREAEVRGVMVGGLLSVDLEPGYTPIVTTHGEILHADRSDGALCAGDLLLCDVGGETRSGWNADITRTWPVKGRFSPTQRDVYQAVLEVQLGAIDGVRPGADYCDLHLTALRNMALRLKELGILRGSVDMLVEVGAASVFFPHGLGHLLGLDVHDMEDLGDRAGYARGQARSSHPSLATLRLRRVLQEGMCVTIEPGFYQVPLLLERARKDAVVSECIDWKKLEMFEDVRGIRIEDDVLVESGGAEVLSVGAPKTVDAIEAVMAD